MTLAVCAQCPPHPKPCTPTPTSSEGPWPLPSLIPCLAVLGVGWRAGEQDGKLATYCLCGPWRQGSWSLCHQFPSRAREMSGPDDLCSPPTTLGGGILSLGLYPVAPQPSPDMESSVLPKATLHLTLAQACGAQGPRPACSHRTLLPSERFPWEPLAARGEESLDRGVQASNHSLPYQGFGSRRKQGKHFIIQKHDHSEKALLRSWLSQWCSVASCFCFCADWEGALKKNRTKPNKIFLSY